MQLGQQFYSPTGTNKTILAEPGPSPTELPVSIYYPDEDQVSTEEPKKAAVPAILLIGLALGALILFR